MPLTEELERLTSSCHGRNLLLHGQPYRVGTGCILEARGLGELGVVNLQRCCEYTGILKTK